MTKIDFSQPDDPTLADQLPEGWVRAQLGAVVWPSKSKIEPSQQPDAPYLGLEHIESQTTKVLGHGLASDVKSTKAVFNAGDVLYGKLRPYLNKVCIPDFAGVCSTDFLVFDQKPWLDSRFLLWSLLRREVVEYANHHSTGVELPRITYDALASLDFSLPPLSEQRRIVDKVQECLAHANSARDHISRVPAILKRFRESILAAACSGRLTEDFPRRLDRHSTDSKSGLPDEELPHVADSWRWVRVGDVAKVKGGKRLPKGQSLVSESTGYPYIRAGNLKEGTVTGKILFLTPAIQKKIARYTVKSGDAYITIVGACIGDAGTIPDEFDGANLTENAAKITELRRVRSSYLAMVLRSPFLQDRILDRIHSASQGKLALHRIAALPIPLPPLEEQEEIISRVRTLFRLADTIEHRVARTRILTDRLTQSILAKAFRGELVPTEAELARREGRDYEPASVLLERIRKERESHASSKPERKRKRKQDVSMQQNA